MLNKHSSARSLAFVFSEMLMRNFRAFMLLLEHLERDALGKNSAWGLGSSICLHVNHFQSKLRVSWALRWVHCCLHQILNLAVLVGTAHLLLYQSSRTCPWTILSDERASASNHQFQTKSLLLQSQKFCQMFFKFEYLSVIIFVDRNPATVEFDCDFFAFSEKKTHYHFHDSNHGWQGWTVWTNKVVEIMYRFSQA